MVVTSYFKTENKLKDKLYYHSWKTSLDLTLEEHEVLDCVQGKVVEPPSYAPVALEQSIEKVRLKLRKL